MADIAQHALPLRPAALVVIALHAALLLIALTRLNQVIGPHLPDVLVASFIPDRVAPRPEPPGPGPRIVDPAIPEPVAPEVPMDSSQDDAPAAVATVGDALVVEPARAEPTVWTRPEVIERGEIPYPTVGATKPEGVVRLRLRIGIDGRPREVLVGVSSGYPALDRAARKAVIHWRFKPRLQDGRRVESWAEMPIVFRLED